MKQIELTQRGGLMLMRVLRAKLFSSHMVKLEAALKEADHKLQVNKTTNLLPKIKVMVLLMLLMEHKTKRELPDNHKILMQAEPKETQDQLLID